MPTPVLSRSPLTWAALISAMSIANLPFLGICVEPNHLEELASGFETRP